MRPEWDDVEVFLADNLREFRPFAYFDKHMDCIRVKIRDCSVKEVRLNRLLTVLKPNYGDLVHSGQNMGFTIKGVAHLFKTLGLPVSGVQDLVVILDAIVKEFPSQAVKSVVEEFAPVAKKEKITVNFDEEKLAA